MKGARNQTRRLQRKYKYKGKGAGFFGDLWMRLTRRAPRPQTVVPQQQQQQVQKPYVPSFFNRLFGRRPPVPVAVTAPIGQRLPVASPTIPKGVQERPDLPTEDLIQGQNRSFVFLYNKLIYPEPGIPLTEPQYAAAGEPYKRLYGVKLNAQQRDKLRQAVKAAIEKGLNVEQISQQVFHMPLDQLNNQLRKAEGYRQDQTRDLLYERQGNELVPVARAESWGGYLERYLDPILYSDRQANYTKNYLNEYAAASKGPQQYEEQAPITTLVTKNPDEERVVYVATGKDNLKHYLDLLEPTPVNINTARFTSVFPFIILEKGVYPNTRSTVKPNHLIVRASALLKKSFIQDAFKQKRVDDVEENLANVLKREAPDLWYQAEVDRVNIVPVSKLSDNNRENFIIVKDGFADAITVDILKNIKKNLVVRKALAAGAVIYADPKTLWVIRRDLPELWANNLNGDTTNMTIYYLKLKNEVERFVIGYLQAVSFMNYYKMLLEEGNKNLSKAAMYEQARLVAFTSNLAEPEVAKEMIAPFEMGLNSSTWRTFLEAQYQVPHAEGDIIRSPTQLKDLMRQFNPEFEKVENIKDFAPVAFTEEENVREKLLARIENANYRGNQGAMKAAKNELNALNLSKRLLENKPLRTEIRGIKANTVRSIRKMFEPATSTAPRLYRTRKNNRR